MRMLLFGTGLSVVSCVLLTRTARPTVSCRAARFVCKSNSISLCVNLRTAPKRQLSQSAVGCRIVEVTFRLRVEKREPWQREGKEADYVAVADGRSFCWASTARHESDAHRLPHVFGWVPKRVSVAMLFAGCFSDGHRFCFF